MHVKYGDNIHMHVQYGDKSHACSYPIIYKTHSELIFRVDLTVQNLLSRAAWKFISYTYVVKVPFSPLLKIIICSRFHVSCPFSVIFAYSTMCMD